MTQQIFIGYRLKSVVTPEVIKDFGDKYLKTLEVPPSYAEKADKRQDWLEKERTKWLGLLPETPYLCTFDEVTILAMAKGKGVNYKSEGRAVGGKKPPICQAVRNFILGLYPDAWSLDTHPQGAERTVEVAFMGFNPRLFLKILGLECSLPVNNCPLPASMWYGNTDHRDIAEAVAPTPECKAVAWDWDFIVQARRMGLEGDRLADYDKIVAGWTGPGKDTDKDARLAAEWALQLGFVPPKKD